MLASNVDRSGPIRAIRASGESERECQESNPRNWVGNIDADTKRDAAEQQARYRNDAPARLASVTGDEAVGGPSSKRAHHHPGKEDDRCRDGGFLCGEAPNLAQIVIEPKEKNVFRSSKRRNMTASASIGSDFLPTWPILRASFPLASPTGGRREARRLGPPVGDARRGCFARSRATTTRAPPWRKRPIGMRLAIRMPRSARKKEAARPRRQDRLRSPRTHARERDALVESNSHTASRTMGTEDPSQDRGRIGSR